jgi:hypothetical protein
MPTKSSLKYSSTVTKVKRNYGPLKGRLAEALIERVFLNLDMEIYPVGFETKLPRVAQLKAAGKIQPKIIEPIEYGPDFVVCRPKNAEGSEYDVFQIEVKYRKDGTMKFTELDKYDDENLFFVFLDGEAIYCIQKSELKDVKKNKSALTLNFKSCKTLAEHTAFDFSPSQKASITLFQNIIVATFKNFLSDLQLEMEMLKSRSGMEDLKLVKTFKG